MSKVEQARHVLMVSGQIIASGDDARVLIGQFALHNPKTPAVTKPWRKHKWIDGIPGSVHKTEHCEACKAIRQVKGRIDNDPCRYPERLDEDIEMIEWHPPHNDDRCCPEHEHHARPHVGCFLR